MPREPISKDIMHFEPPYTSTSSDPYLYQLKKLPIVNTTRLVSAVIKAPKKKFWINLAITKITKLLVIGKTNISAPHNIMVLKSM